MQFTYTELPGGVVTLRLRGVDFLARHYDVYDTSEQEEISSLLFELSVAMKFLVAFKAFLFLES